MEQLPLHHCRQTGREGRPQVTTKKSIPAPILLPKTPLEWKLDEAVPLARLRLSVALVGSRKIKNQDHLS